MDGSVPTTDKAPTIEWVRRWKLDGIRAAVALLVLVVTVVATTDPPAQWEIDLFRAINDLPKQAEWVLWPFQQAGMALAVPVGAVILYFLVRHWRPPVTLLAGGIVFGWGAAKVIKSIVDRGRPEALLDEVKAGFEGLPDGLGFPSGHAVVVFTLGVAFSPYLPRWARWLVYGFGVAVIFSRMYVGAHMPLDMIGGAAFGILIGSAVNLVSGLRADRARPEALRIG